MAGRFIFVFVLSQFSEPDYLGAWNWLQNSPLQSEAKCKTIFVKISFTGRKIKGYFHINGFAPSLALRQRLGITGKWPIEFVCFIRIYSDMWLNMCTYQCEKNVVPYEFKVNCPPLSQKWYLKQFCRILSLSFTAERHSKRRAHNPSKLLKMFVLNQKNDDNLIYYR